MQCMAIGEEVKEMGELVKEEAKKVVDEDAEVQRGL